MSDTKMLRGVFSEHMTFWGPIAVHRTKFIKYKGWTSQSAGVSRGGVCHQSGSLDF